MTRFDDLDRALAVFFETEAIASAPDALLELVTATTVTLRPRPAWRARLDDLGAPTAISSRPMARLILIGIAVLLALVAAAVVGSQLFPRPRTIIGVFEPTGALTDQTDHVAVSARLTDGRVVLAGGFGDVTVFDPALDGFATVQTVGFYSHAAIAAAADSTLLFGQDTRDTSAPEGISVVRLDARTGSVSPILASSAAFGDASPESAYVGLDDGRVLIVGQILDGPAAGSTATLIYDPRSVAFVRGPGSSTLPGPAKAIALRDGRVLLVGAADSDGIAPEKMAIFDPRSDAIVSAGTIDGRDGGSWTVLADGRILVGGGVSNANGGRGQAVLDIALLVDPRGAALTVTPAGRLPEGRWMHGSALLADGRVLLVGGDLAPAAPFVPTASTVLYDPATNAFAPGPSMLMARIAPKVVPLADGRVLVAGHYGLAANSQPTGAELTAEVFR
jgi:hypothetical protein